MDRLAPIIRNGLLALLVLFAAGCGSGNDDSASKKTPAAQATSTCPICGSSFMTARAVTAEGATGPVVVCSQACAIRVGALRAPLASRPAAAPDSQPDEDR